MVAHVILRNPLVFEVSGNGGSGGRVTTFQRMTHDHTRKPRRKRVKKVKKMTIPFDLLPVEMTGVILRNRWKTDWEQEEY